MPPRRTVSPLTIGFGTAAIILSVTCCSQYALAEDPKASPACAAAPVTAKGEPGSFQWSAKTKARANWRAKVRAMSDLGPDYATWGKAKDPVEDCQPGPDGITCVFTGTPCKP